MIVPSLPASLPDTLVPRRERGAKLLRFALRTLQLDVEEMINSPYAGKLFKNIIYSIFFCLTPPAPFPAHANDKAVCIREEGESQL